MSALLAAVEQARERRDYAEQAFREALERAREAHSLREIAGAAGLSFNGVRWLLGEDPRTRKGKT